MNENLFLLGQNLARDLLPKIKNSNFDFLVTFSDGIAQALPIIWTSMGFQSHPKSKFLALIRLIRLIFIKFPTSTIEVPVDKMIDKLIELIEKPSKNNFEHICPTKLHLE